MAELKRARIPMPSAGMNTVAPPGQLPDGKGPLVRNFLPNFPGKMVMRGPFDGLVFSKDVTAALGSTNVIISGIWSHNDKLLVGYFSTLAERVPPWKTPYLKQTTPGGIEGGQNNVAIIDTTANTIEIITGLGTSGKLCPVGVGSRIEGYTYGYGIGSETDVYSNLNGGYEANRPLIKWTGGKSIPIEFTKCPRSAQYVKNYLSTLFVLGGRSPEETSEFVVVPPEAESVVKAASSQLFFHGNVTNYFPVGAEIKAINGTIPAGATITSAVYGEGEFDRVKVVINKEVTSTAVGLVETKRAVFKPEPNTLFYVSPGVAIEDSLTTWKSPTTGLINRIIVGDDDRNDFGVALAVVKQTLVIFKRKSVWALYGNSPETFQVRNLTMEFGCVDPNSICETHLGVYFMSQNGLQYFNGEEFNQVDAEIESITVPLVTEVAGEAADQKYKEYFGRITVADVGNGYLMMSIARQKSNVLGIPAHGEPLTPNWVGMMHMETGNWSEFTSSNFESGRYPVMVGRTYSYPYLFDSRWITDLNSISGYNEKINRDSAHAPATAIPAKLWTDRIMLSAPGYISQLHRLMQDYTFPNGANDVAAVAGWYWSLKDGNGVQIQESVQLPGTGLTATAYLRGRRWELDNFNELIDGRLEIEWKSSTLEVKNPELYDATIEFSVTRQRRST